MRNILSIRLLLTLPALAVLAAPRPLLAAKPSKEEKREYKREAALAPPLAKDFRVDKPATGKPGTPDGATRLLERLREALEVNDDEEWAIIAERVRQVYEARVALGSSTAAARGGPPGGDKAPRSVRPGGSAHPEQDALRAAVRDRLPDAEIRARLARAHEVQEKQEARLAQTQAELRAVLTVRQEAVAVLAGLLPP